MEILSVFDPAFKEYGQIVKGYDFSELLNTLKTETPLPEAVEYVASVPALEKLSVKAQLSANEYGGMPIQVGYCNGHNTRLNCLEYHRDSEINLGVYDFILLLAKMADIEDGVLDTSKVKAFLCPAGTAVEVFGSTLHYAPCSAKAGQGFQVMIVLPLGTNGPKPEMTPVNEEDKLLWACNKWLLAHPESDEAAQGAVQALKGINVDIAGDIA